ncbi:unnamed protein product [Adineta steineri]|uniref:CCHC-type domain-containing protein n=1 Tax=Adineta steineri TaxID=433720 RepID=A0A819H4V2_9BILA|nr:unnamed protein product [Adineta steineri]CAF3890080.1 unnamed protein product [Adineta steineri]
MPSKEQAPKSLIVSKVSLAYDETWIFDDLNNNYPDVKKVSRNYDQYGNQLGAIRVDFNSEEIVSEILNEGAIYIEDRSYYVRPYWPLICYRCQNEGHISAQCPKYDVPEWRLDELLQEQQTNFENLMHAFENKWNTRISTIKPPSNDTHINLLLPVVNDLATVCHQINQNNIQIQNQLSTITNNIQNIHTKLSNQ